MQDDNVKNKMKQLQEPFTKELPNGEKVPDHQWRVQTTKYGPAICVPYITARQVSQRLDEVFGADNWSSQMEKHDDRTVCTISVRFDPKSSNWVDKSDVGTPSDFAKIKGETSDAFKRAAVQLGVGRYLYDMKPIELKAKGKLAMTSKNQVLDTPEALTSYINHMHPLRSKLVEIYHSLENKDEFQEMFNQIYAALK